MKKSHMEMKNINTEPKRRLSFWRVLTAVLIVGGLAYGTTLGMDRWRQIIAEPTEVYKPWFAAYVDVTSVPVYAFEQLGSTETPDAVLAFIVSSLSDPCVPTWGTHYTMDEASY
jgi:chitinase